MASGGGRAIANRLRVGGRDVFSPFVLSAPVKARNRINQKIHNSPKKTL